MIQREKKKKKERECKNWILFFSKFPSFLALHPKEARERGLGQEKEN